MGLLEVAFTTPWLVRRHLKKAHELSDMIHLVHLRRGNPPPLAPSSLPLSLVFRLIVGKVGEERYFIHLILLIMTGKTISNRREGRFASCGLRGERGGCWRGETRGWGALFTASVYPFEVLRRFLGGVCAHRSRASQTVHLRGKPRSPVVSLPITSSGEGEGEPRGWGALFTA